MGTQPQRGAAEGKRGENVFRLFMGLFCCLISLTTAGCGNQSERLEQSGTHPIEAEKRLPANVSAKTVALTYTPLVRGLEELHQDQPQQGWSKQKSVPFGADNGEQLAIWLYQEQTAPNAVIPASIYAMLESHGSLFPLGEVGYSPSLDDIATTLLEPAYSVNNSLTLIGAIGTPYSEGRLIGYDRSQNKWFLLPIWGAPQAIDLDGDGSRELLCVFSGLHLNPPNVLLLRWNQDHFEAADLAQTTGNQYAKLVAKGEATLIEAGKLDGEPELYRYSTGTLRRE